MTNTEQYIRRIVEDELDKAFIKDVVEIAGKFRAPGFRDMLIEEALDYMVYKRLKEELGEYDLQERLSKCQQIYDDVIQKQFCTGGNYRCSIIPLTHAAGRRCLNELVEKATTAKHTNMQ